MATKLKKAGAITAVGALALSLIGGFEGLRTTAYRDVVGIPTICFGETKGVHMGDKASVEQCKTMLADRLIKDFEPEMRACITKPDAIPDKSYVAFLSLSYNIGSGAFCKSSVVTNINKGNYEAACNSLLSFNKARVNGKLTVVKGLDTRRKEENKLCMEGVKDDRMAH